MIDKRYRQILDRIDAACNRVGRSSNDVTLVAVSKRQPIEAIEAVVEAGCLDLGESRVQEWRDKSAHFSQSIRWHFIGHLQRNKAKYLVDGITLLHSLESRRLVDVIEKRATTRHQVLIEVNIGGELAKSGVRPEKTFELIEACRLTSRVQPVGLMCIPPYSEDPESSRIHYREMGELFRKVRGRLEEEDEALASTFTHLSMGMSNDFEVGVEEGATLVRVGTAVFGPRER